MKPSNNISQDFTIQSSRAKFLQNIINRCKETNFDLLIDILKYYSILEETEIILRTSSNKSLPELATEIIALWRNERMKEDRLLFYGQILVEQGEKCVRIQELLDE